MTRSGPTWKALRGVLALGLVLACATKPTAGEAAAYELDPPAVAWMQAVLDNWERACRRDLDVPVNPLPWIIFYDDKQAWHVNPDQRLLPPHTPSSVALRFAGRTYQLVTVAHQAGRLWVPGREAVAIDTAPATTMPYDNDRRAFFIAPLPVLFHRLAGADAPGDLDEFFVGLTAHELTHTRQLAYAAKKIRQLRARYKLPESLDDNVIERTFEGGGAYKTLYDQERKLLMRAVIATDVDDCRRAAADMLTSARVRKERFFVGDKAGYSELEDVFLAMEGPAMWVQYRTARDRARVGEDWLTTLGRLSARMDAWSQEEGLGLFLLIDRLVPDWQRRFLSPDFPSPFGVLREAVATRSSRKSAKKK